MIPEAVSDMRTEGGTLFSADISPDSFDFPSEVNRRFVQCVGYTYDI